MAFLDNSGNIILDAVLTDHGRQVLAKGDGSFQITKFALGDDEIDYSLYNKLHPSGSSYFDLEIMQTPVLEAFTNNASSMKSRLLTYENLELLYLPVIRLNERTDENIRDSVTNSFVVCADVQTEDNDGSPTVFTGIGRNRVTKSINKGFLFGESIKGTVIRCDQGLDTTEISPTRALDAELIETSYIVQLDGRLLNLVDKEMTVFEADYTDDDHQQYYSVDDSDIGVSKNTNTKNDDGEVIRGPRGTRLEFRLQASLEATTSTFLFTTLGGVANMDNRDPSGGQSPVYFIDTIVTVTGVNTGAQLQIPVRLVKLQ